MKKDKSVSAIGERLAFFALSIGLAILGGEYWLLAWCLLLALFMVASVLGKTEWQEMIPVGFLLSSGAVLLGYIVVRLFFMDYYLIPSQSMAPSLLPGDRVLVSKMIYGPRLPQTIVDFPMVNIFYKILVRKGENHIPEINSFKRIGGHSNSIAHRDIVVFNNPNTKEVNIKRCVGLPGDVVEIKGNQLLLNQQMLQETHINLGHPSSIEQSQFTHLKIPADYGPILIPGKGMRIELNQNNFREYQETIEYFEGKRLFSRLGQIVLDGRVVTEYTFTQDYYFMLGDNRKESQDSRNWGLVPFPLIIGKAKCILYSSESYFDRFLKAL